MKKQNPYYTIISMFLLFFAAGNLSAQLVSAPDFNGDGISDLGHVWSDNGSLSISALLSDGAAMTENKWVNQTGSYDSTQRWFFGDFNADGFSDAAVIWNDAGSMSCDVYISTDTNADFVADTFVKNSWATQSGTFNYSDRWFVGDFNGDFKADVARVYNENDDRSIDVYLTNATNDGFDAPTKWANRQRDWNGDNVWLVGDFNGDFATDFAVVETGASANIAVHVANPASSNFAIQTWESGVARTSNMKWLAEDFTGDSIADVAKVWNDNGKVRIDVHVSSGTTFAAAAWESSGTINFAREDKWIVGDFNGDFNKDIGRVINQSGTMVVEGFTSTGAGFTHSTLFAASNSRAYRDQEVYMLGDFDGDFAVDLAVMWGDSTNWNVDVISLSLGSHSTAISTSLTDYFDRHNLAPEVHGDKFNQMAEIKGATPPGADLQAVLDSGADLELVQQQVYNVNQTLEYRGSYQGISTYDAEFIGDYAIIRMQIDLGEYDTVIDGDSNDYLHLENITVDGNKYALGQKAILEGIGQGAMVFFANAEGVWVRRSVFYNTRTWSTLQMHQAGGSNNHIIENNYVLAAGNGPRGNGRDLGELGNNVPGGTGNTGWSDGFSIGATDVTLRNNFIMDCTDVGLVLFGAPGAHVHSNMIFNYSRECLGSVNMVDAIDSTNLGPVLGGVFSGLDVINYRGDVIENNRIASSGARIQMGIPFSRRSWTPSDIVVFDMDGGAIRNNLLEGGAFGYGYIIDYAANVDFHGNTSTATHTGKGQGGSQNGNDPDPAAAFLYEPGNITVAAGGQLTAGSQGWTDAQKQIVHLLFMNGAPQNADGYKYYAYTDPEIDTTIEAAFLEMLGRTPTAGEYATYRPNFNYGTYNTSPIDTDYIGDYLRRTLMTLPEFTNKFGNVGSENLHVFRTARWRDRIKANDENELISTGNYPDPKVVYDNVLGDLVHPGFGALDATITSISPALPTYMVQGQEVSLSITVENSGTETWVNTASDARKFALASVGDDSTFGVTRYYLPNGVTVLPNASYTFNVTISAPPIAWTGEGGPTTSMLPYDFRMIRESVSLFGDSITDFNSGTHQIEVEHAVEPPPSPQYNTIFVSQELQGDPHINGIQPGATFTYSATFMNAGNYTSDPWVAGEFYLGSENPRDNQNWGTNRAQVENTATVLPGQSYTFQRVLTAPLTPGTYDLQWQMLGTPGWFGATTQNLQITVSAGAPAIALNDANFQSITAPPLVLWNDPFSVDITFQNTGTSTWTDATNFKFGNIEGTIDRTSEGDATITHEYADEADDQAVTYQGYEDPFDNNSGTKYFTNNANAYVDYQFGGGRSYQITKYAVISAPDEGPGPEIVNNGSFDANANGWNVATFAGRSTDDSYSGGASLRLHRTSAGNTGTTSQTISGLSPNTDYELSYYIRQVSGTQGLVVIDAGDTVWDGQFQETFSGGQPTVWEPVKKTFNTGTDETSFTFRIFAVNNFVGTCYIDELSIVQVGGGGGAGDPASWTLSGSNDGTNFTPLDSRSNIDFPTRSERQEFTVTTPGTYTHYRFDATNNSGSTLQYSELQLLTDVEMNIWTGSNRVSLPGGTPVLPGGTATFSLNLTAPGVLGDYFIQGRMLQENTPGQGWFGDYSPSTQIIVSDEPPPKNNSTFVGQTGIPSVAIKPGSKFRADITFENWRALESERGNTTWTAAGGYRLGSQNTQDNTDWGTNRSDVMDSSAGIVPGSGNTYTFRVDATAPAVDGVYNFQWKVLQSGVEWFGDSSTNVQITVDTATGIDPDYDDATFVSQVVPTQVGLGETFEVRLTYTNSGTTVWDPLAGFAVGSESPTGNTNWGSALVTPTLEDDTGASITTVAVGQTAVIILSLTAPAVENNYDLRWRLNDSTVGRFGDFSTNASVIVSDNVFPTWNSTPVSKSYLTGTTSISGTLAGDITDDGTANFSKVAYVGGPSGDGSWLTIGTDGALSGTLPTAVGAYVFTVSYDDGFYAPVQNTLEIHVAEKQWLIGYPANEVASNGSSIGFWNMDAANFGTGAGQLTLIQDTTTLAPSDVVTMTVESGMGRFGGDALLKVSTDGDTYDVAGTAGLGDTYFPNTGSITLEAWVRPTDLAGKNVIMDCLWMGGVEGGATDYNGYRFFVHDGVVKAEFRSSTGGTTEVAGVTAIPANQWSHVAVSFDDNTDTFRVFVNGVHDGSLVDSGYVIMDNSTNAIKIGSLNSFPSLNENGSDKFDGYIDEVRISNQAISFIFPDDIPVWSSNVIVKHASTGSLAESLASDATDNNALSFAKTSFVSGPSGDWLNVGNNGDLTGTIPSVPGLYIWTVTADDSIYDPVEAQLNIYVENNDWPLAAYDGSHPNTIPGALWHMDSAVEVDNDLVAPAAGTWNLSGAPNATYGVSAGQYGNALDTTAVAVGEYFELNGSETLDDPYFPTGDYPSITVEFWINVPTPAVSRVINNKYSGGYEFTLLGGGQIRWTVRSRGNQDYNLDSTDTVGGGGWHHVAGVYDANTEQSRLYINGVEQTVNGPISIPGFQLEDATGVPRKLRMNTWGASQAFVGLLDEVRISNTPYTFGTANSKTPYELWRDSHFSPAEIAAGDGDPGADPDGDGFDNLAEFSSDTDPQGATDIATTTPDVAPNGSAFEFTFRRAQDSLTYTVQTSTDLSTWSDFAIDPGTVGGDVMVSVPDSLMNNGKLFIRLKVDEN